MTLKTVFIGNENIFDRKICEWLSERTDVSLIIWTNKLYWAGGSGMDRTKGIVKRFKRRIKTYGVLRIINEMFYYSIYKIVMEKSEAAKVNEVIGAVSCNPRRQLSKIMQLRPDDIKSTELQKIIVALNVDAIFAMCIDAYLPMELINIPKYGSYLWHEGITPEYRGVYSPFWVLAKSDYEMLGYSLLKMNRKLDAGAVYVQGKVKNIDPHKDWHSFIGHKAIIDSLPEVDQFLLELEQNKAQPIIRDNAVDGYYSYPTATALTYIAVKRFVRELRKI